MAADGLIDQYLAALGRRMRSRRDRTDLLDEVADHLLTAVERLESLGIDHDTAQRRALARFGEPRVVASLITSIPSKGNIVSLFFSRHLGWVSLVVAALWLVASMAVVFGNSEIAGGWTPERYVFSAAVVCLAILATTAALVGVNLRATGQFDGSTLVIAVIGTLSAAGALFLCWVTAAWMPLLAVAVTWTFARARHHHAGSRAFGVVTMVVLPLVAIGSIVWTVVALTMGVVLDALAWTLYAGLAGVLVAGMADLGVRLIQHSGRARARLA